MAALVLDHAARVSRVCALARATHLTVARFRLGLCHRRRGCTASTIDCTDVPTVECVLASVAREMLLAACAVVTQGACIRLDGRMREHVLPQVSLRDGSVVALVACKRLLPRVDADVQCEVVTSRRSVPGNRSSVENEMNDAHELWLPRTKRKGHCAENTSQKFRRA